MIRKFEPSFPVPISMIILLLIANGLIFYLIDLNGGIQALIFSLIFINTIGWLLISGSTNHFIMTNNSLKIRNYLRPWIDEEIKYEEIESIGINDAVNIGSVLTVKTNSGKRGFSTDLDKDDLIELVDLLNRKMGERQATPPTRQAAR